MSARILVVEDEEPLRELILRLLVLQGFEVSAPTDGHAALLALARSPGRWQAMMLDRHMPPPDGMQVFRMICGDPLAFGLQGVLFFSSDPPGEADLAAVEGPGKSRLAIGSLLKPAGAPQIVRELERLLRPSGGRY